MSDSDELCSDHSLQRAKKFDVLCDEFEKLCLEGKRPDIESFLLRVDGPDKQPLLIELIALEMHYRRRQGETIAISEYLARFPGLSASRLEETIQLSAHEPQALLRQPPTNAADVPTVAPHGSNAREDESKIVKYFGDYELLNVIARGGMGIVYKARQVSLDRIVALKMILSGDFASKEEVERFYSEAKAAALLDHPGIVPIFEVGEHEGKHFFSMAYVEGSSLASKLSDGPLEPMEAVQKLFEVSQAVHYAHEQGVIHRDLKPSNILLDQQGHPRVTDFGLAKRLTETSGMTVSGQVLGTPSYMPPEQAAGHVNAIGPVSDVYALGAVLYALTTGRPPFQAASSVDTLRQVIYQEPVAPRQLNTGIPRDLETIILKCLNKRSADRYATSGDLADDLQRFHGGLPIQARPIGYWERTVKWVRRQPTVAALGAVSIVAALSIVAVLVGQWYQRELEHASQLLRNALEEKDGALINVERYSYISRVSLAQLELERRDFGRAEQLLEACPDALRGWEWSYFRDQMYPRKSLVVDRRDSVTRVAFTPNGRWIALGSRSGVVRIQELVGHKPIELPAHPAPISAICFHPDGRTLLTADESGEVRTWLLPSYIHRFFSHPDKVGDSELKRLSTRTLKTMP